MTARFSRRQLDFAQSVMAREVLKHAAQVLRPAGIHLMPLKGIWLHSCVYDAPEQRPLIDVDALVRGGDYQRSVELLQDAGFALVHREPRQSALAHPTYGVPLDLHRALFHSGTFDLPARTMFERGSLDAERFGVEVMLPDPRDAVAHLVGHFVKSRMTAQHKIHLLDFARFGERGLVEPVALARHLGRCGMARAARYALSLAQECAPTPYVGAVLDALPHDRVGRALCRLTRTVQPMLPADSPLGALPPPLLDRTLSKGLIALGRQALSRWRVPMASVPG